MVLQKDQQNGYTISWMEEKMSGRKAGSGRKRETLGLIDLERKRGQRLPKSTVQERDRGHNRPYRNQKL